jgi:galactosyl transferase GMA12/MNN10 family
MNGVNSSFSIVQRLPSTKKQPPHATNGSTSTHRSESSHSSKVSHRNRCCNFAFHGCCRRRGCGCRLTFLTTRKIIYLSPVLFLIVLLCVYIGQRLLSFYFENIVWEHPSYHFLQRTCTPPNYYTYTDYYNSILNPPQHSHNTDVASTTTTTASKIIKPKICITTLTDETNKSFINKVLGWRNFDGIMALTWENKYNYAQQHNYYIYDESHVVNHTRGPSWFKIIAVLRLLQVEHCDWVFWMDADMVIMNSTIQLEDFLPYYRDDSNSNMDSTATSASKTNAFQQQQPNYDLLLSMDLRGSSATSNSAGTTQLIHNGTQYGATNTGIYNAGAWIIRNSEWSINFLTTWWNMKSYVQPIGHSFSGDNHALKDLLRYNVSDFNDHCLVPPRCTFNSFAKFVRSTSPNSIVNTEQSHQQLIKERTYNEAYYHKTDFVAHVAGVDNKRDTIQMLLELAQ